MGGEGKRKMLEHISLGVTAMAMIPAYKVFCNGIKKGNSKIRLLNSNDNSLFKLYGFWETVAVWALINFVISAVFFSWGYFSFVCFVSFLSISIANLLFRKARACEAERVRLEKLKRGDDVIKKTIVSDLKENVIKKLEETNQKGPLVVFPQCETQVEFDAIALAKQRNPWQQKGWHVSDEDRAIVVGVPGSGKTAFLVAQIVDWMSSGRSFVVTDIKPEIWSILKQNGIFEKYGYSDWVINPTCEAAHKFNLFSEIEDDADLNEVLAVIIPLGEGDNAAFADTARRLLKAVLLHLGDQASLPAARDFIVSTRKISDLLEILRESDKANVKRIAAEITNTAGNDRLMASIMTAMSKAFEFMDDARIEASISCSDFSIKEILKETKQAVFLQFEQKYKNSLQTLFGGTVAYILRVLQATAVERSQPVFVGLDEIINAAPIPRFAESLNTMRSAKMPLVMYLQSIEGLNRLYGDKASEIFLGSADLKVIFRLNDNATSEYIAKQFGDTEVTAKSESNTKSYDDIKRFTGESYSSGLSSGKAMICDPSEILALQQGIALIIYRGVGASFSAPSYFKDFPMPNRSSNNPRPS